MSILSDLQEARAKAVRWPSIADKLDLAIAAASGPTWRGAVGVFAPIPGSSLLASFKDPMAIDAWNGLAAGAGAWYSVANGGHADSSSNAAYALDFTADAPKWVLLRPKSAQFQDAPSGYYADGSPSSRHSYYSPIVIKARNRVMLFSCPSGYEKSYTLRNVDGFRLSDNQYDPAGTFPPTVLSAGSLIAGSWCKDPVTEDVYGVTTGRQVAKWTQATGQWNLLPVSLLGGFGGLLCDHGRNRLVQIGQTKMVTLNLATNAISNIPVTGTDGEPAFPNQGMVAHDTDADVYYAAQSDGRVFRVDPNTGAATKIATLPPALNGLQSRFAYFPAVKGLAYYGQASQEVWFMPTA